MSIEEERVAWLLGSEFSRKGQHIVMVGRTGLRRVRGEKIKVERIDDAEDGTFAGGGSVQGDEQDATVERDSLLSKSHM